MMCVKPDDTRKYCEIFEENGIAGLHIDIMDGSFVPNFTLGADMFVIGSSGFLNASCNAENLAEKIKEYSNL